ncbi:MAG TPA: hypothetical protein VFJ48_09575 [Casimicrobiaceae bacterium]|nr:hypothetical protein [Casimicrobiaceae bacterium]
MLTPRAVHVFAIVAAIFAIGIAAAAAQGQGASLQQKATTLTFGGKTYVHRWSKDGQNEYTQPSETDLDRWRDMVTINVNESVRNGDQLAVMANSILANYQKHGKIVRTDSKPRTPQRPAEHLIVALLGNATLLEAAFARIVLIDGVGVAAVYSHRVYGKDAAAPIGDWLQTNGPTIEETLMTWDKIPSPAALKQLPQSR